MRAWLKRNYMISTTASDCSAASVMPLKKKTIVAFVAITWYNDLSGLLFCQVCPRLLLRLWMWSYPKKWVYGCLLYTMQFKICTSLSLIDPSSQKPKILNSKRKQQHWNTLHCPHCSCSWKWHGYELSFHFFCAERPPSHGWKNCHFHALLHADV